MRQKVRGLRPIERQVLQQRQQTTRQMVESKDVASTASAGETGASDSQACLPVRMDKDEQMAEQPTETGAVTTECPASSSPPKDDSEVVLAYCAAVRGILNDDQGGPLSPPGLRMAEALTEVRASLERNLKLNKPGPAHRQLRRLAKCIDKGLAVVKSKQRQVEKQVKEIRTVASTLDKSTGKMEKTIWRSL